MTASPSRSNHPSAAFVRGAAFIAALLYAAGCGEQSGDGAARLDMHVLGSQASGLALELPAIWAGRYKLLDSITAPANGLQRQLTVRYLKADSTLAMEAPLLIIRVFSNEGWGSVSEDSAGAWWGTVVARDGARTVAVKPSRANPLAQGTADALAYDSLMLSVLARPMRASLRAPGR